MDGFEAGTLDVGSAVGSFDLSPDGTRIAVEVDGDIWIHFAETDAPPFPLTLGDRVYRDPSWGPDGSFVYVSARGETDEESGSDLYRIRADGAGPPEVVREDEVGLIQPVVGPDGAIVFTKDLHPVGGHSDIHATVDGWTDARAVVTTDGHVSSPALSPDGRWLAYASDDDVYVTSFPEGRGRRQISNGGGRDPVWGPDGSRIFFRTETGLRVADVEASEPFRVRSIDTVPTPEISTDDRSYDVFPDGRILVKPAPPPTTALRIVLNWSLGLEGAR